jgi:hypothetical protein
MLKKNGVGPDTQTNYIIILFLKESRMFSTLFAKKDFKILITLLHHIL